MTERQTTSPRRRLRDLRAIPDNDRTDEQWDELNELEIMLAPANRIAPMPPPGRRNGESPRPRAPRTNGAQLSGSHVNGVRTSRGQPASRGQPGSARGNAVEPNPAAAQADTPAGGMPRRKPTRRPRKKPRSAGPGPGSSSGPTDSG